MTQTRSEFDQNGTLIRAEEFDEQERRVFLSVYDPSSTPLGLLLYEERYDENGVITERRDYVAGDLASITIYKPDSTLIDTITIYSGGAAVDTQTYRYDTDDILTQVEHVDSGGVLFRIDFYEDEELSFYHLLFYTAGVETTREIYDPSDVLIRIRTNFYVATQLEHWEERLPITLILFAVQTFDTTSGFRLLYKEYVAEGRNLVIDYIDDVEDLRRIYEYDLDNNTQIARWQFAGAIIRVEFRDLSVPLGDGQFGLSGFHEYLLDEKKRPAKILVYDGQSVLIEIQLNDFWSNNAIRRTLTQHPTNEKPLKLQEFSPTGELLLEVIYTYRSDFTIESIVRTAYPTAWTIESFLYDEHELLVEHTVYRRGEPVDRRVFTWQDPGGGFILKTSDHYHFEGGLPVQDTHEEFDECQQLILREEITGGVVTRRYEYTYHNLPPEKVSENAVRELIDEIAAQTFATFLGGIDPTGIDALQAALDQILDGFLNGGESVGGMTLDQLIQNVLACATSGVEPNPITEDPELFFSREILERLDRCLHDQVYDVLRDMVTEAANSSLGAEDAATTIDVFATQGFTDYENVMKDINGEIQRLRFKNVFNPPPVNPRWQPVVFNGPPEWMTWFTDKLEAFRDILSATMETVRQVQGVVSPVLQLVQVKVNALQSVVDLFITESQNLIDSLFRTGLHGMYLDVKQRSVAQMLAEFQATIPTTEAGVNDAQRFAPAYKSTDATCGVGFLLVAPDPVPILDAARKLGNLFAIPIVTRAEFEPFTVDINYGAAFSYDDAEIIWTGYGFDHIAEVAVTNSDGEAVTSQRFTNTATSQTNRLTIPDIERGRVYVASVGILETKTNGSGAQTEVPFRSGRATFETPSTTTEIGMIRDSIGSWSGVIAERGFRGVVKDATWFSASIDAFFPDFGQFKEYLIQFLTRVRNSFVDVTFPTDRIIAAIDRRITSIINQTNALVRQINAFIKVFEIDLEDIAYYKWITPDVGGISRYASRMISTEGVPAPMLNTPVFTAGIFIAAGAPTLDGVLDAFDILTQFLTMSDESERNAANKALENATDWREVGASFEQAVGG